MVALSNTWPCLDGLGVLGVSSAPSGTPPADAVPDPAASLSTAENTAGELPTLGATYTPGSALGEMLRSSNGSAGARGRAGKPGPLWRRVARIATSHARTRKQVSGLVRALLMLGNSYLQVGTSFIYIYICIYNTYLEKEKPPAAGVA